MRPSPERLWLLSWHRHIFCWWGDRSVQWLTGCLVWPFSGLLYGLYFGLAGLPAARSLWRRLLMCWEGDRKTHKCQRDVQSHTEGSSMSADCGNVHITISMNKCIWKDCCCFYSVQVVYQMSFWVWITMTRPRCVSLDVFQPSLTDKK